MAAFLLGIVGCPVEVTHRENNETVTCEIATDSRVSCSAARQPMAKHQRGDFHAPLVVDVCQLSILDCVHFNVVKVFEKPRVFVVFGVPVGSGSDNSVSRRKSVPEPKRVAPRKTYCCLVFLSVHWVEARHFDSVFAGVEVFMTDLEGAGDCESA